MFCPVTKISKWSLFGFAGDDNVIVIAYYLQRNAWHNRRKIRKTKKQFQDTFGPFIHLFIGKRFKSISEMVMLYMEGVSIFTTLKHLIYDSPLCIGISSVLLDNQFIIRNLFSIFDIQWQMVIKIKVYEKYTELNFSFNS